MTTNVFSLVPIEFSRCSFFRIYFLSGQNPPTVATTLLLKVSVLPLATPSSKGHSSISVQDNLSTTGLQLDHIDEPYYPRHHPAHTFIRARVYPFQF